ncbi:chorismate mutase [Halosimplex aquaticum]|uniref:Chorismate mutase n=1 Tax=Halosimplex aquaticum TaxID=3026162 RepID=A0ABD5Y4Y1_9EURY|nr:chorismate mutase [Halosimplex aquaticum]
MTDPTADLTDLRADIDRIDAEIADLIAERVERAEAVADVKSSAGRALVDEDREATVASHHATLFAERGLDPDDGRALAEFLIDVALDRERTVDGEA